jgi:hypothetical protein
MNKPADDIFAIRPASVVELPLATKACILHPEQVILKIGANYNDLGACCYALRSSKPRKPRQAREVVIGSLLKSRAKQIGLVIQALSDLIGGGKRLWTVDAYAYYSRLFLDWADANGHHDCLAGEESTRLAYQGWASATRESYLRQEFAARVHNDRMDYVREILEAVTGVDDLERGFRRVKESPANQIAGTEPLSPQTFGHVVALNQALFDGLCNLVLEQRPFPFKLELPASLGWQDNHLWLFPARQWRLPPHHWGAMRESRTKGSSWAYDYANGRVAEPSEITHRYSAASSPAVQRLNAKKQVLKAHARIEAANANSYDPMRVMLGMLAHHAFLLLYICNTAANESVILEVETTGEVDAATSNQQFRSIKFRANGKAVTLTVPATFMPTLRRFMELRRYLLKGQDFPYLFFTLGFRNANPPAQLSGRLLESLYEHQLRTLDPSLPRIGPRRLRASAADWYQRHKDRSITAKVLQNTEESVRKRYDAGSTTDHHEELSTFLTSVAASAKHQRVAPSKTDAADALPLEEGGCCDGFGHPEALSDQAPVTPNCKDSQGCLFCVHRVLIAGEEDARKVASASFVMEQVILGPHHEEALRPLIAKCDEDLEKIAAFPNCRPIVDRVRKDVFEYGNLTPFFQDKYQLFLELGVIVA